jgi:hypothetical protein
LGVLLFVALHATLFTTMTWTALEIRTGVWSASYLAAAPLMMAQFASFFGFSGVLATVFRSSVVSTPGALLCWAACLGVNTAHHAMTAASATTSAAAAPAIESPARTPKKSPDVVTEWLPPSLGEKAAKPKEKTREERLRDAGNDPATGLPRREPPSGKIAGAAPKPT